MPAGRNSRSHASPSSPNHNSTSPAASPKAGGGGGVGANASSTTFPSTGGAAGTNTSSSAAAAANLGSNPSMMMRPQSPNESIAVPAEWMCEPNPSGSSNGILGSHFNTSNNTNKSGGGGMTSADASATAYYFESSTNPSANAYGYHNAMIVPTTVSNPNSNRATPSSFARFGATNSNNNSTSDNTNILNQSRGALTPSAALLLQQQQQQQQVTVADCLARTNQLSLFFQDKLFTWGGWLGTGTDKPPSDVLCCYDLNSTNAASTSSPERVTTTTLGAQQRDQQQQQSTLTSPSPAPTMNTVGWLNNFYKINNQQQCHPAVTQFAWCEIGPGVAVLFGGWTGLTRTNTVTILSIPEMSWKTLETSGDKPPPLTFASLVSCYGGKKLALYGGNGVDGPSSDVYTLDMTSLIWRQLPSAGCPPRRSSHSACLVRDSLMVVFGGRGVSDLASLSLADGGAGGNLTSLAYHGSMNNPSGQKEKGGKSGKGGNTNNKDNAANNLDENGYPQPGTLTYANTPLLMNDFGVFDLSSNHWQIGMRVEGIAPCARYGHSVVATHNHIIIFGGIGENNTLLNDVWVLSFDKPGTIVWKPVTFRESAVTPTPGQQQIPSLGGKQDERAGTPGGASASSSSSSPFQPSPRVGSSLSRISKSCIAVACGRVVPETSLVGQNFSSNSNNTINSNSSKNKITSLTTQHQTTSSSKRNQQAAAAAALQQQQQQEQLQQQQNQQSQQQQQKRFVSSGVYFLDISKIISDELNPPAQQQIGSGRGSADQTPQP